MRTIYFFGLGLSEGSAQMRELLGGKGAGLAEMGRIGLPVPPGFTITTQVCIDFYQQGGKLSDSLVEEIKGAVRRLESLTGKQFGNPSKPLLLSVRSGARSSMPGMMDTVLNIGLNPEVVEGLAKTSNQPRFAWDSYRRLIQMYSDVVLGVDHSLFEVAIEDHKRAKNLQQDQDLDSDDWKTLCKRFLNIVQMETGKPFPHDPLEQLLRAVESVFHSWNGSRAVTYRRIHGIPDNWGTAVNVQTMVFGNRGPKSATGVAFTRNPSTGEKKLYGEFLPNAQGEDVVAGIRTPLPIAELKNMLPEVFAQFQNYCEILERHYKDMQDIEFTIDEGELFILQTRTGKRTTKAALKIACDLLDEKVITVEEAILRIDPASLDQLLHPSLDPDAPRKLIAKGLGASPGGVSGRIVFDSESAVDWASRGEKVILLRQETSPEDIGGMHAAVGILTTRGGMTSHAAVVARGMGKTCIVGCGDLVIDSEKREVRVGNSKLKEGDWLTLDGSTGQVFEGVIPTREPEMSPDFERIMKLADEKAKLKVRTNADTPHDARMARKFGAVGIGLCRTEHMFFGEDRIDIMRQMIMAETSEERKSFLEKLLPIQQKDFYEIFKEMAPYPVTVRLLDPPLHEFIPHSASDQADFARRTSRPLEKVKDRAKALYEFNPMLGHRGCRLAVTYPEIYEMQVEAIAKAWLQLKREGKESAQVEIMMPLVGCGKEMKYLRDLALRVIARVEQEEGIRTDFSVGTMIELPMAALLADEIAQEAEFFSFGTNDLTQTTWGISRDDASRFLDDYLNKKIWTQDPFQVVDKKAVGALMEMACLKGRSTRLDLKLGICGEHGGNPDSIHFFHKLGLNYVSCSPYRVPGARLAAAHAAILNG